ncbi:MAG: glycosyl transferase family 36 [Gammaproteobacteria bacterium]|nr:glycosyl transferase family 36 [Gammaproteobacteria bacterium]
MRTAATIDFDRPGRLTLWVAGLVLFAGALAAVHAGIPLAAAAGAGFGLLLIGRAGGATDGVFLALRHAAVAALFALAATPELPLWQTPREWIDLLRLTPPGATLAFAVYGLVAGLLPVRQHRPLPAATSLVLLVAPFALFNGLFLLASRDLLASLGGWLGPDLSPALRSLPGCWLVLGLFGELAVQGLGVAVDQRWTHNWRLRALLWSSALWAALTPHIADLGSGPLAAALPGWLQWPLGVASAALAQAGLWGQTFLITGALLDALKGRRPTWQAAADHWRSGAGKGAVYSAWFMVLVYGAALAGGGAVAAWISAQPLLFGTLLGMLLFPLARSLIETFDGSPALAGRLGAAYREPANLLRGAVAGFAVALWFGLDRTASGDSLRFAGGALAGAAVYAGVGLLVDALTMVRGLRQRPQRVSVYLVQAVMGGVTGGLLAWYFDAGQLRVVLDRVAAYGVVNFPAVGRGSYEYMVYPLFSKWGATDLGLVSGGVKLFYAQSLSGVVQWAIAAPLFSLNLVLLTALIQRRLAPIRATFSRAGLAEVGAQTVRVLRWGLWMAPIISIFLRMAQDPTWYNQDGAVRSLLATAQQVLQPTDHYRAWSLDLFLGLMAYDWLRVLIWFDHMGLRVATLVNFSFVGMDAVNARLARALSHGPRGQAIPEGLRRFATWAPLLVPFYIPRGGEWEYVWTRAEGMHGHAGPLLPAVRDLVGAYAVAAVLAIALGAWVLTRARRAGTLHRVRSAPAHVLGNGLYMLRLGEDGRGHAQVIRPRRGCPEIDLTRRPEDDLDRRGRFFYVSEPGRPPWSLTRQPCPGAGVRHRVTEISTTALCYRADAADLTAFARVEVPPDDPVECWTITFENPGNSPRRLRLTSFQELTLGDAEAASRHPAFNALHVGTRFVAPLAALLAHSRLLTDVRGRPAGEVAFHAVATDGHGVRLAGYEDSRNRFVGAGGLACPDGLAPDAPRAPDDEGLLYSFDPALSLTLGVTVPARSQASVRFVTGYAANPAAAAQLITRWLGTPLPPPEVLERALGRARTVRDAEPPEHAFSPDGWTLGIDGTAPRPYSHLMVNAVGQGAVLDSAGCVAAFAGNSQQNALTPFRLSDAGHRLPGEALYVVDLATDTCGGPAFAPLRRGDIPHRVEFAPGQARFASTLGELDLDLTVCVPPDVPAQLRLLRIANRGAAPRRCRVVACFEWVLAELPADSRGRLELATEAGVVYARNPDNLFVPGWAFVASSLDQPVVETVRSRFTGTAAGLLPCFVSLGAGDPAAVDDGSRVAAFSGEVEVPAGGELWVNFALGQAPTHEEARALAARYRDPAAARAALVATETDWRRRLGELRVETNRKDFDRLVNIWLPYQVLNARLWGRCGPEQRSGAYGFRDQLQDVLPLLLIDPGLAREQILRHARQQFPQGDVLHWWHPTPADGTGFGARTRASDPQLWLPYITAQYVAATGDISILEEKTPFLEGEPIPYGADGIGFAPRPGAECVALHEHCRRAIDYTLARRGRRGLPLIGTGDWNDALDRIGHRGRGESVWLGFFLHRVLLDWEPLARRQGDTATAARWHGEAVRLRAALAAMRRGESYVRAIADDGTELLHANALTAAWPALSGAVAADDALAALRADLEQLEGAHLVRVQTPAFDAHSIPWPGRIALYPPGVRENGGQYSHGASWLVDALTALASDADNVSDADHLRAEAFRLWQKISPLGRDAPELAARYGLAPHQQPADIYSGPSHEGRGGWSWYTGAAARMLWAAYGLLGIDLRDGVVTRGSGPSGGLELYGLRVRGERLPEGRE